jgi:predicted DNA repair protein MutK
MATSLLALLDDITTVLDDVAILAKVAAKKTSGVLGDDLALNANQVAGVQAERELPVVWAVAKGSFKNKAILVPSALVISAAAPWAVTPLLMIGGLYLCYEGFEKIAHRFLHTPEEDMKERDALVKALADPKVDLVAFEKDKISGAIRTDFILSAEIIVITLGAASAASFVVKAGVLTAVAVLMTVFVYGFVAAIVKLDDLGLHLSRRQETAPLGRLLLLSAPVLMKALSVLGTAAMFLVGGGILTHALPFHAPHPVLQTLFDGLVGVVAGALVLAGATLSARVARRAGRR